MQMVKQLPNTNNPMLGNGSEVKFNTNTLKLSFSWSAAKKYAESQFLIENKSIHEDLKDSFA